MKIAVSGKGGVGKTTLSAILAKYFAGLRYKVVAVDADPDMNLAATLGFSSPETITPVVEMKQLIRERTGIQDSVGYGAYFKLNPKVDDIPGKYAVKLGNNDIDRRIKIITMGTVRSGGAGCACPENVFLKALLSRLLLLRDEIVIVDMAAGIEQMGRGTVEGIDNLLVVVDPGRRSLETAKRIEELAADIGIKNVFMIGNRIENDFEKNSIVRFFNKSRIAGFISQNERLLSSSILNEPLEIDSLLLPEIEAIINKIDTNIETTPSSS